MAGAEPGSKAQRPGGGLQGHTALPEPSRALSPRTHSPLPGPRSCAALGLPLAIVEESSRRGRGSGSEGSLRLSSILAYAPEPT